MQRLRINCLFGIFYDGVLGLGLLAFLPKILLRKKLSVLRQRLRSDPPDPEGRTVVWIHAVSVGEVKSAKGLLEKFKTDNPDLFILVTTATSTGLEEAKSSLVRADAIRFMPFDFSWLAKAWVRSLKPKALLFIESDFWFNLLTAVKAEGGKTALVSGKISERSAKRFGKIPFFAKKLFSLFDLMLVQNGDYLSRFESFLPDKTKLQVGGNLKLDALPQPVDRAHYEPFFKTILFPIVLVSTHAPEEAELLDALQSIDATLFLAPRHPERFLAVEELLRSKNISYCRWSLLNQRTGNEKVFLIDSMGQMPIFFTFCQLAIVAGSFSSRIGGHNVLEPCLYGTPVFFGPHMNQQKEFKDRVLEAGAGKQVEASDLPSAIRVFALDPHPMRQAADTLFQNSGAQLQKTWAALRFFSHKNKKAWE